MYSWTNAFFPSEETKHALVLGICIDLRNLSMRVTSCVVERRSCHVTSGAIDGTRIMDPRIEQANETSFRRLNFCVRHFVAFDVFHVMVRFNLDYGWWKDGCIECLRRVTNELTTWFSTEGACKHSRRTRSRVAGQDCRYGAKAVTSGEE